MQNCMYNCHFSVVSWWRCFCSECKEKSDLPPPPDENEDMKVCVFVWMRTELVPPPRSELWPSLRWCTGTAGQHGGSGDSSSCLQSAVMPDGVLIDYLAVSHPFITSSPCWTPEVNGRGLCVSDPPHPPAPPTCNRGAWRLIYERRLPTPQTAGTDSGMAEEIEWSNLWPLPTH